MMRSAAFRVPQPSLALAPRLAHGLWYGAGAVIAFLVPFVFSSALDLGNDAYYAVYFATVGAFLGLYARATRLDVRELFVLGWKWSLVLGAMASAFVVWNVLTREDSTPRPDGAYFLFTIGWRGVLYGVVDALLLTAFPVAVALGIVGRPPAANCVKGMKFAGVALALVMVITAVYHLGYEQYREDGVGQPEVGNTIISLPAILTANPLGSVVAHASMHVTADIHAYETETFLPPTTEAD